MGSFMKEFKEFAMKGNVMDLAVGMIIGAAFTAIISALVDNILSPLIGLLIKVDFNDAAVNVAGVDIMYGAFIMAIINFIIVAFVLFVIVRTVNAAKEKANAAQIEAEKAKAEEEEAAKKAAEEEAARKAEEPVELLRQILEAVKK